MKYLNQKSLLQYVISHRNGYLAIACGSLFLNILLGIGLISSVGHEKIILVPPTISKTFWVSSGNVSSEYLAEMSLFFADLRFNVTSSNAANQREMLLQYVSPEYYEALKTQLINEEQHINQEHISTAFYMVDVRTDVKRLSTLITGDLISSVGTNQLPSQRVTYQVNYSYHNGRLLVKSFEEIKSHA